MKATINVEFTDDELRKYAEDVARRVGLNFIHDTIRHLRAAPGDSLGVIAQSISNAFAAAVGGAKGDRQIPPGYVERQTEQIPKDPKCKRVEASPFNEESWLCHECVAQNWASRDVCRICGHRRCDVITPPPPPPGDVQ